VILPAGFGVNPTNACFWAFLVPFLVTPVVSWMTPGLSPDLLRRAFK
jgi:hypothetical protein